MNNLYSDLYFILNKIFNLSISLERWYVSEYYVQQIIDEEQSVFYKEGHCFVNLNICTIGIKFKETQLTYISVADILKDTLKFSDNTYGWVSKTYNEVNELKIVALLRMILKEPSDMFFKTYNHLVIRKGIKHL